MKKFLALFLTILANAVIFAQEAPPIPNIEPDYEETPVNMYIVYLAVFMVGMAVWMFKKNIQKAVK